MRYRYYNPNPKKNNASDCVVRMLCAITGKPWVDCFLDLTEKAIEIGDMPSINATWMSLLRDMGFKRYVIPDTCPSCYNFEDFCIDNPVGVYVIGTGTHVATVKDGILYDSWNSLGEVPIFYFRR